MGTYYKPQSPIQSGEDFIYPITTADQVKVDKDTRLNAVGVYLKNIDNSTDTTVYGNNATTLGGVAAEDYALKTDTAPDSSKLGGVAASDYALKTDTAPDSSKLGGKAPEYYLSPRNLLDNSDFRNPVNQRGVSSVTTTGHTIDRWFLSNAGDGISISDDGVTFNATNSLIVFLQKIDKEIRKVLIGKTITVAATDSSGNVGICTCIVPNFGEGVDSAQNSIGDTGLKVNIYTMSNDDTLHIRLLSDSILSPVTIVNIALYEGSYTADTLPPYVPKGYAAELAECMRYYYRLQNGTNFIFRLRNQHETNNYAAFDICPCITFPVPMRIVPTVSMAYDITDGTLSVGAPFDCSRTSCTVPNVSIPHGGWFDLNSLVASADL